MQELNFKQWVLEIYGKSIYQIELEVAIAEYCSHKLQPHEAWLRAQKFLRDMEEQYNRAKNV